MKTFLLEIGSEEIPARFVSRGMTLIKDSIVQLLDSTSLEHGSVREYATPRRLTVAVEGVGEKQKDRIIESLGPPKKIAYDSEGRPTKAALGFARSLNIEVGMLAIKETDRGEYLAARIEEKGREAKDVLSDALPALISSLPLPRSMRWGEGSLRFFRPIQWILALFGSDIISFSVDGIQSGDISRGHRFLSRGKIRISDPDSYVGILRENYVIADPEERRRQILEGIGLIESSSKCSIRQDSDLLETVTNLVEYPTAVLGRFDDRFTSLPRELLITVMKSHQKYFSLQDGKGEITSSFIVVSNTKPENDEIVRKGAERVLRARLEDARFYYTEDLKKNLADYREDLKKVTFQEKLGSLYKKTARISALCSFISDTLRLSTGEPLNRAALLCKADLVTGVVGEFPELQGYMGMMYALNSGEDKETAEAIYEHYLPKFAGDALPSGHTGSVLSMADKMDNIACFFSLAMIPTGSEDPYALRRQAAGILNIIESSKYPISLNLMIEKSLEPLVDSAKERVSLSSQILQFFRQRLEGMLLSQGYSHDMVSAVLSQTEMMVTDISKRINSLAALKKDASFPALLTAAKRVYNILASAQPGVPDQSLFTDPSEKVLFSAAGEVKDRLAGDFSALFRLEEPVNTFFDAVLVMDKNPEIKNNRLALLLSVKEAFDALGDFSKLVE